MLEKLPSLIMTKIYRYFLSTQQRRLEKYNLTQQQVVFLLIILEAKEGIGLTDLTNILDIDKSNITRTIQFLERKGYIEKEDTGRKAQKYILKLTKKGNETAVIIKQDETDSVNKFLSPLEPEEQKLLNKIIDKLLENKTEDSL